MIQSELGWNDTRTSNALVSYIHVFNQSNAYLIWILHRNTYYKMDYVGLISKMNQWLHIGYLAIIIWTQTMIKHTILSKCKRYEEREIERKRDRRKRDKKWVFSFVAYCLSRPVVRRRSF